MIESTSIMTESKNKRVLNLIIHMVIWITILLLPFLFEYQDKEKLHLSFFLNYSVPILFIILIFYFNYFYLIVKTLFKKKIWQFFIINIITIIVFIVCKELIHTFVITVHFPGNYNGRVPPPKIFIYLGNLISSSLVIGLSVAIKMTAGWYQLEAERKELEKAHLESELSQLKNQLNPHFFFNTLNNIYSLISINSVQAQEALHQLSKLTRYILYETDKEMVPLKKEIDFLENYIHLMSLRLSDNTKVEANFENIDTNLNIAPLLYMALVENAFKHGVDPDKNSFIELKLIRKENTIEFIIMNSNFQKDSNDKSGSGIGLSNLQKRLRLIYPERHKLIIDAGSEVYKVNLSIQL